MSEGGRYNLSSFSAASLISPANLELIGNLSGCEAVRRTADCSDLCFHSKFRLRLIKSSCNSNCNNSSPLNPSLPRSIDGSCNHHTQPLWGASLTPLRRVLPPQYENGFNSAVGEDPDTLYHGHRQGLLS